MHHHLHGEHGDRVHGADETGEHEALDWLQAGALCLIGCHVKCLEISNQSTKLNHLGQQSNFVLDL